MLPWSGLTWPGGSDLSCPCLEGVWVDNISANLVDPTIILPAYFHYSFLFVGQEAHELLVGFAGRAGCGQGLVYGEWVLSAGN